MQGLLAAVCVRVQLPAVTYGEVNAHPGGNPSKITAPSGNIEYDDMTVVSFLGEGLPDLLYVWWRSIVDPLTGLGVAATAAYRPVTVQQITNLSIPQKTHQLIVWPQKREWEELEGGSDDPNLVTMTFKVQSYFEI